MITPSILRFHYENVLRQDLLLKPNYTHIWRVPRLCELVVVPKARSDFLKNVQLAIENLCGQKCIKIRSKGSPGKSFRFKQFVLNQESKRKAYVTTHSARSTLRGHIMYKFLEKLVIIISSHSPVRIQRNFIQFHFSMATTFWLKEFPQIKDNFEIFAHIRRVDVTIVTSANTQEETFLSWSGFKKRKEQ